LFSPETQGSRAKEQTIAKEVHPNPGALSQGALKLMARNTNQVFGDNLDKPVDFVLFYAKETGGIRPQGGTGQAVEMARLKGIPAINLATPNWREELNAVLKPKPSVSAYVTVEELETNKSFLNTAIEFIDEISTDKETPVAMRNVNKGEKIQMVKDLMQKKFDDKAWTSPATQRDGSTATALPAEQFKSFNEFLTFALLHEKAHETISKVSGETVGEYEDRINAAALENMPKPPAEFEGELEGADNPNPCGQ
jgi:hypothetical protein